MDTMSKYFFLEITLTKAGKHVEKLLSPVKTFLSCSESITKFCQHVPKQSLIYTLQQKYRTHIQNDILQRWVFCNI